MVSTESGPRTRRPARDDTDGYRRRLLDGLAACIAEQGYAATTVADIVRRARTSLRTFYAHFTDKNACYIALLTDAGAEMSQYISTAVDPTAPWDAQVRQAVTAWITAAESAPSLTLSWIRDLPSLGATARAHERASMDRFVTMIQSLADTAELRAAGIEPLPRQKAIILLGGLRELMATTLEDGGRISDVADLATEVAISVLRPR